MFRDVPITHSIDFHGQKMQLETGLLARQATASVLASIGETTVLAAVVVGKETMSDYFPLQVIYEEKLYASGKIKGSRFEKREGKPSENAVLTGRMIDRSLRSLFSSNIRSEVQVVITVLSMDEVNPPDTLSVVAASAALQLAGIEEFAGPVSGVRIGLEKHNPKEAAYSKVIRGIEEMSEFVDIRPLLTTFSEIYDANMEENRGKFKEIFEKLNAKNPEWLAKFKLLYKSTEKRSLEELSQIEHAAPQKVVNPSYLEIKESLIDLTVSGNGENICMLEAGAEIVKEEVVGECLELAAEQLKFLNEFQNHFLIKAKEAGLAKKTPVVLIESSKRAVEFWNVFAEKIEEVYYRPGDKLEKDKYVRGFQEDFFETYSTIEIVQSSKEFESLFDLRSYFTKDKEQIGQEFPEQEFNQEIAMKVLDALESLQELSGLSSELKKSLDIYLKKLVKKNILEKEKRLDGRRLNETRQIICQPDVLSRTHGSSLFQRGDTQVLNTLTLGSKGEAQLLDNMEDFEEYHKRYIHHYNFPQYSVGETGRYGYPGRREIGHGALAEKALLPVLPSEEDFPYTMRLVSECLGSNGSTSMASTCASCLSLMDGGVPIKGVVAGVAMGLILDEGTGNFKVLTDILGAEDHFGDMDFKVTGTDQGITAIQLDNKVAGLTVDILKQALTQAREGRIHILNIMKEAISEPRKELSEHAPRVVSVQVPFEKIGDVIGPSGKIIKGIIAQTGTTIDIEDDTGLTLIYGKDSGKVKQAEEIIKKLIKDYVAGDVVEGKVFRIENYGAFAKIDGTEREGLIHISEIAEGRTEKVTDVLQMGQTVQAKIIGINEKGQINLSIKQLG
jgi:polyribonucleotide nucleotidyltransferase